MKSELKIKAPKSEKITYPCLMQSIWPSTRGLVVLFTGPKVGTCISVVNDRPYSLGDRRTDWAMETFEPMPEGSSVTLTA